MPSSPPRPCSKCGQPVYKGGLCRRHYGQADRARGTSSERGYGSNAHRYGFRAEVLFRARNRCQWTDVCPERAIIADHYPRTRKQLVADGDDPDNPDYGRALCKYHHDSHTASTSIARAQQ